MCSKIDTFISACIFLFMLICEQQYPSKFPNSLYIQILLAVYS